MAGPYCTMILADMGAEVVKLERPGKGIDSRLGRRQRAQPLFPLHQPQQEGHHPRLQAARGEGAIPQTGRTMDVLVENYRPTVMPRAGLGFDALHEVNPRLIYAQLSGLGYDGPYAGRGGFDLIAQGMGGIMHVTGEPRRAADLGRPADLRSRHRHVGGAGHPRRALRAPAHRRRAARRMLAAGDRDRLQLVDQREWLADHEEPTRQGSRHRQNAPYQRMRPRTAI